MDQKRKAAHFWSTLRLCGERRKVQAELAMGSRENVASAKVRIEIRVAQKYSGKGDEERNRIRDVACGNTMATKKALYRASTKRFTNVCTLRGLTNGDCRYLWVTLRGRSALPGSAYFDEMLMRHIDEELAIFSSPRHGHSCRSIVHGTDAGEESAVAIDEGRQQPNQPLALTAEIDANIEREKSDILAFLNTDFEDEQFAVNMSHFFGRVGHLVGFNAPPRAELDEQMQEAAAMEEAEASLDESGNELGKRERVGGGERVGVERVGGERLSYRRIDNHFVIGQHDKRVRAMVLIGCGTETSAASTASA
uniref:Uncharacterized protein n=1 Tax=Globodera rostochiensis TaxID=31243 RepID=A0A914HWI1_GLORO